MLDLFDRPHAADPSARAVALMAPAFEADAALIQEARPGYADPPPPFYASPDNSLRLYQADALELLRRMRDESVDMIFADPPYFLSNGGITCVGGRMVRVDKGGWDKSQGIIDDHNFNLLWLDQCRRILKPNGTVWVTGTSHNIHSVGYALQVLDYKILNDIAWYKVNPPPNLACRYFTHSTEIILWAAKSVKSRHTFNYPLMKEQNGGKQMQSLWQIMPPGKSEKKHGKHPTQKPEALLWRIVAASTQPGELVLDPFCGSATTGVACARLGRQFIGIERETEHITLASLRLQDAYEASRQQPALDMTSDNNVVKTTKIGGGGGYTIMEREDAIKLLEAIKGADLVEIATQYGQKIFHEQQLEGEIKRTLNKGWAGLTLEAYLGLPKNSRREPNGGSWELKQVSIKRQQSGLYAAKETMQITMLDRAHVAANAFETSHVLHKIGRFIIVARLYIDKDETTSPVAIVRPADISMEAAAIYRQVKQDYEMIRQTLAQNKSLHTISGDLIQIRTKGQKTAAPTHFTPRQTSSISCSD
ncbi:MAG: MvaI/BcnI family restriction endonuclease [Janthinobacterium lividum]